MRHSWHNPDFQWYKPLSCGLPEYSLQRGDAHGGRVRDAHVHSSNRHRDDVHAHVHSNSHHRDDVHVHVILYS